MRTGKYSFCKKALVIDRRLSPRCCHMGSYFKRPETQLVLLRTVYSQAQGCVCTVLQLPGDVKQALFMNKYDVIHRTGRGGPNHGHW